MAEKRTVFEKAGYLNENYRYFHLSDTAGQERDFHFHDFDKIVILFSGSVDYIVEGGSYTLRPRDILLVPHHTIHKAVIDKTVPYDRVIVYLNRAYFDRLMPEAKLGTFLERNESDIQLLFSLSDSSWQELCARLKGCELALEKGDSWGSVESDAAIIALLAGLNRIVAATKPARENSPRFDSKISDTLSYINENPGADLSVEALAGRVFLSRYYFMNLFRTQTGSTVHSYVSQRRLLYASHLIRQGTPAARAAAECGFSDYSAFHRAFRKTFGVSPGQLKK